jgi:hypothetical protein
MRQFILAVALAGFSATAYAAPPECDSDRPPMSCKGTAISERTAAAVYSALAAIKEKPTHAMISFCRDVAQVSGNFSEQIMNGCLQQELAAAKANSELMER